MTELCSYMQVLIEKCDRDTLIEQSPQWSIHLKYSNRTITGQTAQLESHHQVDISAWVKSPGYWCYYKKKWYLYQNI